MSTPASFFLDAPSFGSATKIFFDSNLTLCAGDGFYSDGVITRQMIGCVLLPQQPCPSCALPCDGGISYSKISSELGVFLLSVDTGATPSDVGAVIITFTVDTAPRGISVSFNGNVYNSLSSETFGYLAGAAGLPTYVGDVATDSGLVADSPYTGADEYEFDGTAYNLTGTTDFTIVPTQLDLTVGNPNTMVMVIPKTTPSPYDLNMSIFAPIAGVSPDFDFNFDISCPALLPSFLCDPSTYTLATICSAEQVPTNYYTALVNGTVSEHGLYDWVFYDNCGELPLANGYYRSLQCPPGFNYFRAQNGVIIEFGNCEGVSVAGVSGYLEACGPSLDIYMGAVVDLDETVDVDTNFVVTVYWEFPGVECGTTASTESINVTILAGQSSSNFNACSSGPYFPSGAVICSACIASCDNPSINLSSFVC
jgi:hypothetical protein